MLHLIYFLMGLYSRRGKLKVTITFMDEEQNKKVFYVPEEVTSISFGRSADNEISLEGKEIVSRHHAKIVYENGKFKLINLTDNNRTYLNGESVEQTWLENGDIIELAKKGPKFKFNYTINNIFNKKIILTIIISTAASALIATLVLYYFSKLFK